MWREKGEVKKKSVKEEGEREGWVQALLAQSVSRREEFELGKGAHQHLPTVQQDPDPISQPHMPRIHWRHSFSIVVFFFSCCTHARLSVC